MSFVADFEFEQPYAHSTGASLARFFQTLRDDQRILARECSQCGKIAVPPRDYCETCGAKAGDWKEVGLEGTVLGFAVMRDVAFARIRLDGSDTDLIHRVSTDGLERGARVKPQWAPRRVGSINDIDCFARNPIDDESESIGSGLVDVIRAHPRIPYKLAAGSLQSKFMDSIKQGTIFGNQCPKCESVFSPPRAFCSRCWTQCVGWLQIEDQGSVVSFVIVNVPFYGQQVEIPYVLASIKLDGATSTMLHIMHGTTCEIGMRVKAIWRSSSQRTGFINEDIDRFEPV